MNIRKAETYDVDRLAALNKKLIEDEQHPNPMSVEQLAQRMNEWLQGDYTCYMAEEDEERSPIACSETTRSTTT